VQVLRRVFTQLMSQPNPIRIALNVHSAYGCKRYFVYHDAMGTSSLLAAMQQNFIGGVRNYSSGIEPFTYFVSWTSSPPPTYYPESWFWYNYHEAVLANTYEDMNCASAGGFDSTAYAILRGIGDYLNLGMTGIAHETGLPTTFLLEQNYPNPFNPITVIRYQLPVNGYVSLKVFDMLGREIATLVDGMQDAGFKSIQFDASRIPSGVYLYRLNAGTWVQIKKMVLMK
jgi:hypothetical protein